MTSGVLLFAFDNEIYSYRRLAEWSAARINHYLDLPVTLITDQPCDRPVFDQVIQISNPTSGSRYFDDHAQTAAWHNHSRASALDLSPYDETLLLDVDYVVSSRQLLALLGSSQSLLAHDRAWDVTNLTDYSGLNSFGRSRMPMSWATVMYFRKCRRSEMVFDIMESVRDHWRHYCDLYGVPGRTTYRNDHALSIALNIVNGHDPRARSIPWPLASVDPHHTVTAPQRDQFRIEFDQDQRRRYIMVQGQDLHIMGKRDLEAIVGCHS